MYYIIEVARHMYTSDGHLIIIYLLLHRFAFHLRLWWLEGRGITCHQQKVQRPTEKHYPIRVMCQPAGLSDKVCAVIRKCTCVPLLQPISCCIEFNIPHNVINFVLKATLPHAMPFCHLGFQTLLQSSNNLLMFYGLKMLT